MTRSSREPRSGRRPRRSLAHLRRNRTSAWRRRPRTSFTTSQCCCARGDCRWRTPSGCSMSVASPERASAGPTPSLEEVRSLASRHNLIPLRETFIDDCQTPVSAFLKLGQEAPSFLLESADQGRVGRYSFIGFRPRHVLRWSLGDPGDPYALAAAELGRLRAAPVPGLPPFSGG